MVCVCMKTEAEEPGEAYRATALDPRQVYRVAQHLKVRLPLAESFTMNGPNWSTAEKVNGGACASFWWGSLAIIWFSILLFASLQVIQLFMMDLANLFPPGIQATRRALAMTSWGLQR